MNNLNTQVALNKKTKQENNTKKVEEFKSILPQYSQERGGSPNFILSEGKTIVEPDYDLESINIKTEDNESIHLESVNSFNKEEVFDLSNGSIHSNIETYRLEGN